MSELLGFRIGTSGTIVGGGNCAAALVTNNMRAIITQQ